MKRTTGPVLLGGALYVGLTFGLFGLQRLAFPNGSGIYPIWYSSSEVLLKAIIAVGPGFLAAWVYQRAGLTVGAMAGFAGVAAEFIIAIFGFAIPVSEFPGQMAWGFISSVVATGITNAVGGVAGETLRKRVLPSNTSLQSGPAASGRPLS